MIENEEFRSRSKAGRVGAFTRNRALTFKDLLVFIMRGGKSSLQRELDSFFKEVTRSDFSIRRVTKGAFSTARSNLKPEAFVELLDNVNQTFYTEAPYWVWKGFRLLGADGSRLMLPNHPTVVEEFGTHSFDPNGDSPRSLALVSILYAVLNLTTHDAQIAPYSASERDLLNAHLPRAGKEDLLLLDRGYPSILLLFRLYSRGLDFCVRMKEDWWLPVKEFKESGEKERIVKFTLPRKDQVAFRQECPDFLEEEIACRLVCVTLENGEKEILCTSLVDMEAFPYEDFPELYHLRWNEEEGYKLLKARAEVECFTGKTALAVKQDFHARVFAMGFCAILAFPIEAKVRKEYTKSKNKHGQKINRTGALAMFRNISIGLLLRKQIPEALAAFDRIVSNTREIIRPNRKFERKKRPKKLHYMNYKAL